MAGFFSSWWFNLRSVLNTFSWKDALDIILVTYIIYSGINLLAHTRTGLLIKGLGLMLGAYILANLMGLKTIKFIIDYVFKYGLIVLVVIFQPELRSVLERIGKTEFGLSVFAAMRDNADMGSSEKEECYRSITTEAGYMSATRTGALIVFERETPLNEILTTGTIIDAEVSEELIGNIFYKGAPLHDGAVVIRGSRVAAAGCILPVSRNPEISKEMGTRHRAAIGISESTDAVVLVVSEENGFISVAAGGSIRRDLTPDEALDMLKGYLIPVREESEKKNVLGRIIK